MGSHSASPSQNPPHPLPKESDGEQLHHVTLFNVQLGIRYHMRRQAHFDSRHRLTGILSLAGSSAAVISLAAEFDPLIAQGCAATIAIAQAIDLMFDVRKFSDLHNHLRKQYLALEADLSGQKELTAKQYKGYQQRIKQIEMEEPPIKSKLLDACHDELMYVRGYKPGDEGAEFSAPGWLNRLRG